MVVKSKVLKADQRYFGPKKTTLSFTGCGVTTFVWLTRPLDRSPLILPGFCCGRKLERRGAICLVAKNLFGITAKKSRIVLIRPGLFDLIKVSLYEFALYQYVIAKSVQGFFIYPVWHFAVGFYRPEHFFAELFDHISGRHVGYRQVQIAAEGF